LHGLLITALPGLAQGTLVDLHDLEPMPIRARVVRQSDLGTHVSFVDHLHPRYTAGSTPSNRRHLARVPCEAAAAVDTVVGTVLNASLRGVMIRVAAPAQWSVGDRVTVTIDAHGKPLAGEVVAILEDRLSIRFARAQARLRIAAADCAITLEHHAAAPRAAAKRKRAPARTSKKAQRAAKKKKKPARAAKKPPSRVAKKKPRPKPRR